MQYALRRCSISRAPAHVDYRRQAVADGRLLDHHLFNTAAAMCALLVTYFNRATTPARYRIQAPDIHIYITGMATCIEHCYVYTACCQHNRYIPEQSECTQESQRMTKTTHIRLRDTPRSSLAWYVQAVEDRLSSTGRGCQVCTVDPLEI